MSDVPLNPDNDWSVQRNVRTDQLDRLERKIDQMQAQIAVLIDALAQDDEEDEPQTDMAGNPLPMRDRSQVTF